jgi:hypothetical protein
MPGKFKCENCSREYVWKPGLAGRRGKCKCGAAVTVPTEDPDQVVIPAVVESRLPDAVEAPVVATTVAATSVEVPSPIPPTPVPVATAVPAAEPISVAAPVQVPPPTPISVAAEMTASEPIAVPVPPVPAGPPIPAAVAMPVAEPNSETPSTEDSPTEAEPPEQTAAVDAHGHCQLCGAEAPTQHVEFRQNIGLLILRKHRTLTGELCKNCINENFWKMTATTLAIGWLSTISIVLAPIYVVGNVAAYLSCGSLPAGAAPRGTPT